ncbi:MAG: hypothetical protein JNL21_22525 [Myxococcales bacterium]|nr:hypothetical protein [Myxococcales bacterium]
MVVAHDEADQLNKCNSSLSFFDDEGMRFHLPAYLVADLDGDYKFGLAYALTQTPILSEQFRLLSKEQRAAVRRYLEFISFEPDYEFEREHIEHALENYWSARETR